MSDNEALPNEQLALLIIEKLSEKNLISPHHSQEIEKKLALGQIRQDEWRLWIDLASLKLRQEPSDENPSKEN